MIIFSKNYTLRDEVSINWSRLNGYFLDNVLITRLGSDSRTAKWWQLMEHLSRVVCVLYARDSSRKIPEVIALPSCLCMCVYVEYPHSLANHLKNFIPYNFFSSHFLNHIDHKNIYLENFQNMTLLNYVTGTHCVMDRSSRF